KGTPGVRDDGGSGRRARADRRRLRGARPRGPTHRGGALRRAPRPPAPARGRGPVVMRVVVTGLAATYPVGGVAWDYLQYVQGFRALGCDVVYLEDTGQWLYDPIGQTFTDDARTNARWLGDGLARVAPGVRWALRAPDG